MELKEFIKTTVTDIVSAIIELQTELAEDGALVFLLSITKETLIKSKNWKTEFQD